LANIKSAKKRIKVITRKTLENRIVKTQTKTAIKRFLVAVDSGDKDVAKAALVRAISAIDRATTKGILHKNNASRKKSRLTRYYNKKTA